MSHRKDALTKRTAAFDAIKRIETLISLTKDDEFLNEVFTSAHDVCRHAPEYGRRAQHRHLKSSFKLH